MTTFYRDGYWRTSKYGVEHWVEGHSVDRDNWDRCSGTARTNSVLTALKGVRCGASFASHFIYPNATCPVCGDWVFYYQNEKGSRVYFDELGPPWPKHACTDNETYRASPEATPPTRAEPALRETRMIRSIASFLSASSLDLAHRFAVKYKKQPWMVWRIDGRFRGEKEHLLVMSSVLGKPRRLYIAHRRLPKALAAGSLAFVNRARLAYFDVDAMAAIELKVVKVPNAVAFVERIVRRRAGRA